MLADVETDKATMPLEFSDANGRLAQVLLSEGQSAPIGTTIAVIAIGGEVLPGAGALPAAASPSTPTPELSTSKSQSRPPSVSAANGAAAQANPSPPAPAAAPSDDIVLGVSPIARRLAEEWS